MVAIANVDGPPAAQHAFIAMIEVLEPVQIVKVPKNGGIFAVDLEGIEGLMSARVTGRFERRQRAVPEARQESAGVVDANLFHFAGEVVLALLDEGLGHGAYFVNRAIQPDRGIDAVSQQITRDPRARGLDVQAPETGATLRQFRADGPVLKELRAVVEDAPQPILLDKLFGQRNGRDAAVNIPN